MLGLDSPMGAVWWVCDRWQATPPSELELLATLPKVGRPSIVKLEGVETRPGRSTWISGSLPASRWMSSSKP